MFPQDSQMLVDDFRHQNFAIWTFLACVMVILVKKEVIFLFTNQIDDFANFFGEMVVQGHDIQRIQSGYQIPKQAHLSAFLESHPHSLAQKQTSF